MSPRLTGVRDGAEWIGRASGAAGDRSRVDNERAAGINGHLEGIHGARRGSKNANAGARIRGAVAGATEPSDNARESNASAIEVRAPGDGAAEMRALPVERDEAARCTGVENVALVALEMREPGLACGDAGRVGALGRNESGGNVDGSTEACGLALIEEAKERRDKRAGEERETGKNGDTEE